MAWMYVCMCYRELLYVAVGEHAGGHGHGVPVQRQLVQLEQLEGATLGVGQQREPAPPVRVARLGRQRLHREPARERAAARAARAVLVPHVHVAQLQLHAHHTT